jgi:hypothetical protein
MGIMLCDAAEWGTKRTGRGILLAVALLIISSCSAKKEALVPPPPSLRMKVTQLQMAANREFVGVRFRIIGGGRIDPDAKNIYLVDESTGEKFSVVRLQRIGGMAEFRVPGEKDVHHIMFRNRQGKLKIGSRVTVVVGSARQEHLVIKP